MSFADTYLKRYATKRVEVLPDPDPDLFLTVVIPVFSEPHLIDCLESLCNAESPLRSWEILLVINEPQNCSTEDHDQNLKSVREIREFREGLKRKDLHIHILKPEPFARKKAGPGLARKTGMDEALRRFNHLERPEGVIISFDADTRCSRDYLAELEKFYLSVSGAAGCTIYFEHPLDHADIEGPGHRNAMVQYELYLRYFKMSLDWIGYPYSSYSLGSAFSVRAERYVRAGGMGLHQAGEDFYFLQKCIPLGNFWELGNPVVYPSPRISERVVFGTGPFLSDFLSGRKKTLDVYAFELICTLKPVFTWINQLEALPGSIEELTGILESLPHSVKGSMRKLGWYTSMEIAYGQSANLSAFRKRFYHEINLLLIIRLLNELSENIYPRRAVAGQMIEVLREKGFGDLAEEPPGLLEFARGLDREKRRKMPGVL